MPHVSPRTIADGRVAYAYIDDVVITLFNVPRWTDAAVISVMEETTKLSDRIVAKGSVSQFYGEIFGAGHRKMIVDWLGAHGMTTNARNALLTDSQIMRGALTAYAWLTQNETRAFAPNDTSALCTWVTRGLRAPVVDVQRSLIECQRILGKQAPARA